MSDTENKSNIIPLIRPASSVSSEEAIMPKSLIDMTDLEVEAHIRHLRERRLKAQQVIKAANAAKAAASSLSAQLKLEKKANQAQKQLEKAEAAIERLEQLIFDLRALQLQYTDENPDGTASKTV